MTTVGIVSTYPSRERPVGGVATYTRSLVSSLSEEAPRDVVVLAQRVPRPDPPAVPTWDFGAGFAGDILRDVRARRPDLVHMQLEPFLFAHGPAASLTLGLPRWLHRSGVRSITTLHAVPFPTMFRRAPATTRLLARLYVRALRDSARWSERLVVHEEDQADVLVNLGGIDRRRIAVIPHGVDAGQGGQPPAPPLTIGTFGFLTPYKDPEYLLDEFEILRRSVPEARLLFSLSRHPRRRGRSWRQRYERIVALARTRPNVELVGHVPDLGAFLGRCHLLVAPYRYAVSASGVLAHALSMGVPALLPEGSGAASRGDGWSFVYEAGGLARAMRRASTELERMRGEALEMASRAAWPVVAREHLELYR